MARGGGGRSISHRIINGSRRDFDGTGAIWSDMAEEPGQTPAPVIWELCVRDPRKAI